MTTIAVCLRCLMPRQLFCVLLLLIVFGSIEGSILTGFKTKETPENLEDIPNIAEQVRSLISSTTIEKPIPSSANASIEVNQKNRSRTRSAIQRKVAAANGEEGDERTLKSSKSSKSESKKEVVDTRNNNDPGRNRRNDGNGDSNIGGRNVELPFIPEAPPAFTEGELSFVILMDEFGYNTDPIALGTRFAFSGRLATDEFLVGRSSGTCTIGSDIDTNFACCTFYLTFNSDGEMGKGTLSLSGNTDAVGGYVLVTGAGGDLFTTTKGNANLVFDPAGNPIIYILVRLDQ